ncbi:hypothetical protein EUX98_g7059 [Antrodiella citrinella]|uniref:Uncharacterized protein n=1 Tax=Antrodiella citrinella TaxID=2447956 RepID=A0A4S4MPA0_9APHY|nr:hypothetical protein EUX98_g7059 [Antrodiella citrinella]
MPSSASQSEDHSSDSDAAIIGAQVASHDTIALPPTGAGVPEYVKALKKAQLHLAEKDVLIRKLLVENKALNDSMPKRKGKAASLAPSITKHDDDIKSIARRYTVLTSVFYDSTLLNVFQTRPAMDLDNLTERYASDISKRAAKAAELFDEVKKPSVQRLMAHSHFNDVFAKAVQLQRSNNILALKNRATVIFGHIPGFSITDKNAKMALLKHDLESQKYSMKPPILYETGQPRYARYLYRNLAIAKAMRIILFGASGVSDNDVSLEHWQSFQPQGTSSGVKWNIGSVTPGLIAYACISAIYLLSKDIAFQETGSKTKIPYGQIFEELKMQLVQIHDMPAGVALFRYFNTRMFTRSLNGGGGDDGVLAVDIEDVGHGFESLTFDDFDDEHPAGLAPRVAPSAAPVAVPHAHPVAPPGVPRAQPAAPPSIRHAQAAAPVVPLAAQHRASLSNAESDNDEENMYGVVPAAAPPRSRRAAEGRPPTPLAIESVSDHEQPALAPSRKSSRQPRRPVRLDIEPVAAPAPSVRRTSTRKR